MKKNNLEVGECAALTLPFVGNQADFMFLEECDICDRDSEISLSTSMPLTLPEDSDADLPLDPPPDAVRIDDPRMGGLRVARNLGGELFCRRLGYFGFVAASNRDHYATLEDGPEERYVWTLEGALPQIDLLTSGESIVVYDTLWCNCAWGGTLGAAVGWDAML